MTRAAHECTPPDDGSRTARLLPTAAGMSQVYDVAIVGGGPAGLSAGIWLARYLHSVLLIDSGDPRHWETRAVNGFLGQPSIRPADLRYSGREECRRYGVELLDGFVARAIRHGDDDFELQFDPMPDNKASEDRRGPGTLRTPEDNDPRPETRCVRARRLLLAFGLKDEWPKVPGLQQVYGTTAHVCPDCDGYETRDLRVAVIGHGRKAVGLALNLSTWTRDIVICTNGESPDLTPEYEAKLSGLGIVVETEALRFLEADDCDVQALVTEGGRRIACDKVFFKLGQRPADDLGGQLDCERDDEGHIIVDRHMHTSVYNVFAAGDVTPGAQLAISAASDGAVAALAIHKSLVPKEQKLEKPAGGAVPAGEPAAPAHRTTG